MHAHSRAICFFAFYLFISDAKSFIYIYTHTHKKKRNINPKTCTIEKDKFKTKLAQNIDNNMIYTKIFCEFIQRLMKEKICVLLKHLRYQYLIVLDGYEHKHIEVCRAKFYKSHCKQHVINRSYIYNNYTTNGFHKKACKSV